MRRLAILLGALALGALVASGCKRSESPEDRTVRKLKEAMKQPPAMGPHPNQPPVEHLADVASGREAAAVRPLAGPGKSLEAGPITFELTAASEQESVGEGQVKISSEMPFVRVALTGRNDSDDPVQLDLHQASLLQGKRVGGIAPDAQHLSGTRSLEVTFPPHESQDVVLFFEAPAIQPPYVLNLPKPGGGSVQLQLH